MNKEIDRDRLRLLSSAAIAIATAQLGVMGSAAAQFGSATKVPPIKPGTNTSFKSLKQIRAGLLDVGTLRMGRP